MRKNNQEAYENATRGLIQKLDDMNLPREQRLRSKNLTLAFRDAFKQEAVKHATFHADIGYDYRYFPYDSYGFCRASSFSFVALMNSKDWRLMYINEIWAYGPHYFIMHMPTKTPFDLTFDQYVYDGVPVPYELGRPTSIDGDGKNVITRFLHATGLDFSVALKNIDRD